MNSHVHPVMAAILETYMPEPKDIDISREAVDRMIDDLWQYGTVISKKLTAQDATCHNAADMVDALRIALTAMTDDRDSWQQQASDRVDDVLRIQQSLTAAAEHVTELRAALRQLLDSGACDFHAGNQMADDSKCLICAATINARAILAKETTHG